MLELKKISFFVGTTELDKFFGLYIDQLSRLFEVVNQKMKHNIKFVREYVELKDLDIEKFKTYASKLKNNGTLLINE